jgi:multidrug resistance efflux pump
MEKLFTLLELQRRSQEASSRQAFAHIAVNETHKLVSYRQAIFWSVEGLTPSLEKVSGNAVLDEKGPYAIRIKDRIKSLIVSDKTPVVQSLTADENLHVVVLIFKTAEDGISGGLWIENDKPFQDADLHILEELAQSYAHALALINLRAQKRFITLFTGKSKLRKYVLFGLVVLTVLPVRLTMTAPAEIIAQDADIITVPYDGMIETVHVQPGEVVTKGQMLASMENATLSAEMDMARQELEVTQSSVARLSRQSLSSPDKKNDLTAVEAEIENKRLKVQYAEDMRERSIIKASRDGVAVFSDTHSLQGKPMATGEKIMVVADTSQYHVMIRIPVDVMAPFAPDAKTTFFLNVSPLKGYAAKIESIGYQASPDADGLLTYKIYAKPLNAENLRIGWKGTAQIRGNWTILSYAILRRPLAALRRMTGV